MDWFEKLTGFQEDEYELTRSRLQVVGDRLHSRTNGLSYAIGQLETPSLKELRSRAQIVLSDLAGTLRVSCVTGDVRAMHRDPVNENSLFQVASQFNLLEMTDPGIAPEDGVTRYDHDHTQGPACAIAAGAATIYRNYFANVDGHPGQTRERQIDCLRDLGEAIGNDHDALWTMRNGYALCTTRGLATIDRILCASGGARLGELRDLLRIGLHWNVEVTDAAGARPLVSQAFCSALPISYTSIPASAWKSFAALVLDGAYEATLWAAVINAQRTSSRVVHLTQLGGGAFGNDPSWVHGALRRSLDMVKDIGLDVRLVSRGPPPSELLSLAQRY
jgi:hypothetical protein